MKAFLINQTYGWTGGDTLYQAYATVYSTYDKAVDKVRELIEKNKKQIDWWSERHEFTEEVKTDEQPGVTRFWLYWKSCGRRCSHCW